MSEVNFKYFIELLHTGKRVAFIETLKNVHNALPQLCVVTREVLLKLVQYTNHINHTKLLRADHLPQLLAKRRGFSRVYFSRLTLVQNTKHQLREAVSHTLLPSKHLVLGIGEVHLFHLNLIEHHFESGLATHTQDIFQENVLSQVKHV